MFSKRQLGLIYLERDSLYYYGGNIINSLIRFEFPQNTVRDLDVINKDLLNKHIKLFIDTNKIQPANLIIILSPNVIFEKDFPVMEENKLEQEIQKFLDNIPFENVKTKRYVMDKNSKIMATNKLLYETVKNAFEEKGFMVEAITPLFSLKTNSAIKNNFNLETANLILKKFDSMKQDSLPVNEENDRSSNKESQSRNFVKNPKNKRAVVLISVFIALIAMLIFLLIQSGILKTSKSDKPTIENPLPATNQPAVIPDVSPTPVPALQPVQENPESTASSQLLKKNLKINILNSSGIIKQAEILKNRLVAVGFENIITGNIQPTNSTKTLIIFSSTVPDNIKKTITDEVKKVNFDVSVQENTKSEFDCTIIIGKST